ncbi:MAG: sugar phosphate isomerase/epimerase, partial [Candidatus Firestonebacteria bacterium]
MKIGIFLVLFGSKSFEEALDHVVEHGLEAVEIGTGNWPGTRHCDPFQLLKDKGKIKAFKKAVDERGLTISALSCHGNPVHPDKKFAASNALVQRKTIQLAGELGVDTVVSFSGCPGDSEKSKYPNWVTCPWPEDFLKI